MYDRPFRVRHFAALAATVRLGSLTRAARAVNLTQPALTQAIAGLESMLGVTLFDRGPQGMQPTEAARLLAPRAERAIGHIGSPRVTGTQIRAFLAVVRAGSYLGAAKASGLSSASLHRAVADLTVALGQPLIDRRGRTLILTAAGTRRARGFGLALAELRAGLAELDAWKGMAGGRIVIGAMPLSRARWLPDTISHFRKIHPAVAIAVHEGSHAELAGPLRDGDIDLMLGALRDDVQSADIAQEGVFEDRPAIIMRGDHPLLGHSHPVAALHDYPWLMPAPGTPLRTYWEEMILCTGQPVPPVLIECGSVLLIRQLLLAGDELTLLSRDQIAVELDAGLLAAIPPPVPVRRLIGIMTRTDWRPTATQADFLALLRETGRVMARDAPDDTL